MKLRPSSPAAILLALPFTFALSISSKVVHNGQDIETTNLTFSPFTRDAPHPRGRWSASNASDNGAAGPFRSHPNHRRATGLEYFSNWCGASAKTSSADPIKSVSSYFQVPNVSLANGESTPQYAAAWVGIDGATCQTALLQAGATTVINSNGGQSSTAWFEWWPEASLSMDWFPASPGDWFWVNVTALSTTDAEVTITNMNQQYTITLDLGNAPALCLVDADWVVEDFFDSAGLQLPFPAISELWFEACQATTRGGKTLGIDNATLIAMANATNVICMASEWDNTDLWITTE